MKKNNYVNNKTFYAELVKYNEKPIEKRIISNYVGECYLLICNNLAKKPCFNGYSFVDEMVSDAIENCVLATNSFKPEKTQNPFAYFTQIAFYAFIRRIQFEKKQQYIKHKNIEQYFLHGKLDTAEGGDLSDNIIDEFEKKNMTKKKVANTTPKGVEKFLEDGDG